MGGSGYLHVTRHIDILCVFKFYKLTVFNCFVNDQAENSGPTLQYLRV